MPERLRHLVDWIPFIGLMAGAPSFHTPFITRMIEAAIIGIAGSAVAVYVGVAQMKVETTNLNTNLNSAIRDVKEQIQKVDDKVEKVDEKIERVRGDIYVPRGR